LQKINLVLVIIVIMLSLSGCLLRTDFDPERLAELHWITPPATAPVEDVVPSDVGTSISQPIATPDATAIATAEAVMEATMVATPAPECLLKGNINARGEKILHSPGSASYDRTVIDPERGEQWFCDEQSALEAGFRPALR
jgi:micrococcal nuclease